MRHNARNRSQTLAQIHALYHNNNNNQHNHKPIKHRNKTSNTVLYHLNCQHSTPVVNKHSFFSNICFYYYYITFPFYLYLF